MKAKNKDEGRRKHIPPISVIAPPSSVTLKGSEVPETAKSHDLTSS